MGEKKGSGTDSPFPASKAVVLRYPQVQRLLDLLTLIMSHNARGLFVQRAVQAGLDKKLTRADEDKAGSEIARVLAKVIPDETEQHPEPADAFGALLRLSMAASNMVYDEFIEDLALREKGTQAEA